MKKKPASDTTLLTPTEYRQVDQSTTTTGCQGEERDAQVQRQFRNAPYEHADDHDAERGRAERRLAVL